MTCIKAPLLAVPVERERLTTRIPGEFGAMDHGRARIRATIRIDASPVSYSLCRVLFAPLARSNPMSAPFAFSATFRTGQLCLLLLLTLCGCSGQLPRADIPHPPPGEPMAVVFDIDGTLTPKVHTMNTVREHAVEALNILATKGYRVIYLSARIRTHSAGIPGWLQAEGFPEGSIHAAQTAADRKQPAAFKATVLTEFIDRGWSIEYAYGDSSTDFEAYAAVGIPKERVFALQREGDTSCQPGEWSVCLGGWTEHLEHLRHSVAPVAVE